MSARQSVTIDLISDVVCPWCYVGQKRVEKAIATLPDIDVEIHWRPYQLDPTIPAEGKDRKAYMMAKFGTEARLREIHALIEPIGEAEGIDFDFDAITVAPNTLDAHRVVRWAANASPGVQNRLVKRLFQLYFEEGQNIGDHAILIEAARASGMDASLVEAMLPTDADRQEVLSEAATASKMGVTGVPCFVLEGRYAVMGAQEAQTIADAIRQVAAAKAESSVEELFVVK